MLGHHPAFAARSDTAENARFQSLDRTTSDPFVARLRSLTRLDEPDLDALVRLYGNTFPIRAKGELVAQGRQRQRLHILLDGWACRYRLLADGQRQITQILLPGDICDLDALRFRTSDCAVMALTACTVVTLDSEPLRALALQHPRIAEALGWFGAVEAAMLAERNACLGRRSARAHLAHLLCELLVRLAAVGRASNAEYTLPITQEEIADVLGLTSVHVNRVMQSLKAARLIEQRGHDLVIRDWNALRHEAGFRPDYLHLEGIDSESTDSNQPRAVLTATARPTPAL